MTAFILGLLTAVFYASQSLLGKRLSTWFSPNELALFTFLPSLPFLFALLFFVPMREIHFIPFFISGSISFVINIIAWHFFYRALTIAPVGLVVPITSLTPLFILPVEYLLFKDIPGMKGILGIFLSIAGMIILYWPHHNGKVKTKKGILFVLVTTISWSISATVDKVAVQKSSPLIYGIFIYTLLSIYFIFMSRKNLNLKRLKQGTIWIALLGAASTILILSQFTALLLTNVSMVIVLKRSGSLLSVLGGRAFFKEEHFWYYFTGSLVIIAGIVLLGFEMN